MFPRTVCLSSLLSLLIMTQTPHFHALSHGNRWTAGSTVITAIWTWKPISQLFSTKETIFCVNFFQKGCSEQSISEKSFLWRHHFRTYKTEWHFVLWFPEYRSSSRSNPVHLARDVATKNDEQGKWTVKSIFSLVEPCGSWNTRSEGRNKILLSSLQWILRTDRMGEGKLSNNYNSTHNVIG